MSINEQCRIAAKIVGRSVSAMKAWRAAGVAQELVEGLNIVRRLTESVRVAEQAVSDAKTAKTVALETNVVDNVKTATAAIELTEFNLKELN